MSATDNTLFSLLIIVAQFDILNHLVVAHQSNGQTDRTAFSSTTV